MITNAQAFLRIIEDFGSFDKYIWHFSRSKTMVYPSQQKHLCTHNALSDKVAKDLKNVDSNTLGQSLFIVNLQGIGIINDHQVDCDCYNR